MSSACVVNNSGASQRTLTSSPRPAPTSTITNSLLRLTKISTFRRFVSLLLPVSTLSSTQHQPLHHQHPPANPRTTSLPFQSPPPKPHTNRTQTHLRTELQTVHRLPQTRAILFAFHTYLYPLSAVKEEGLGDDLAQAVKGLREGSVPRMWWYKRAVVWGEVVRGFLTR